MRNRFNSSGLVIALLGFFLTRYTVTFALLDAPVTFVIGGLVPLVLGLSLSVFGVVLAVGSFERWYVRIIVVWTLLGASTIGLLIIATVYGAGKSLFEETRTIGIFSNVLIGGSVGGALTGLYAAQNKAVQRELLNRKNRLVILNRLLHDEVMNAVTVIKGSVPLLEEDSDSGLDSGEAILEKARSIEEVMSSVGDIAEPGPKAGRRPVDVTDAIGKALQRAREHHPEARFDARGIRSSASVYASHRLVDVLYHLLVNGAEHADVESPRVTVAVEIEDGTITISVADEGPGLPDMNREALEKGTTIADYGDPTTGLGLYLVRLFVRVFWGSIDTTVTERGTTVSISLERGGDTPPARPSSPARDSVVGVAPARLGTVALVAVFAGLVMGGYVHFTTTGSIPVIGSLYGTESVLIGGLTHEFHSLVFGLIYAGFLVVLPDWGKSEWGRRVAVAVAWGVGLWLVASGIIMPVWLNLVGIDTPVPDLSPHSLLAHVIWGLVLGAGYHLSQRWW